MIGRRAFLGASAAAVWGCYAPDQIGKAPAYAVTPEAELHERYAERVKAASVRAPDTGVAVGLIGPNYVRVLGFGRIGYHDPRTPTGDSVYDIGTLGKVLTGLLLAVLVARGRVKYEMPVGELLRNTGPYEQTPLVDLATRDAAHDLESSVEFALLGRALAAHEGRDFGYLIEEQVLKPLGMQSTATFERSHDFEPRFVEGEDTGGQRLHAAFAPDPNAGAWGLRSTTNDLLRLAHAILAPAESPLAAALQDSVKARKPSAHGGELALGWHVDRARNLLWKNGELSGFRSALLVELGSGRAISVLAADARVDALPLAHELLRVVPATLGHAG